MTFRSTPVDWKYFGHAHFGHGVQNHCFFFYFAHVLDTVFQICWSFWTRASKKLRNFGHASFLDTKSAILDTFLSFWTRSGHDYFGHAWLDFGHAYLILDTRILFWTRVTNFGHAWLYFGHAWFFILDTHYISWTRTFYFVKLSLFFFANVFRGFLLLGFVSAIPWAFGEL